MKQAKRVRYAETKSNRGTDEEEEIKTVLRAGVASCISSYQPKRQHVLKYPLGSHWMKAGFEEAHDLSCGNLETWLLVVAWDDAKWNFRSVTLYRDGNMLELSLLA